MGNWSVVIPEATSNLFVDSSFEFGTLATYWTVAVGGGTGTAVLSTTTAFRGYRSVLLSPGTAGVNLYQSITTAAASYVPSICVKRTDSGIVTSADVQAYLDGAAVNFDAITSLGDGWYYCTTTMVEAAAAHNTGVRSVIGGTGVYVDALQFERKAYATIYCDGDQLGCTWSGAAHASTSSRSAQYRGGGRVRDFYTDYGLMVTAWEGWGMPEVKPAVIEYATLPGGLVQHVKPGMRQWQLVFDDPSPSLSTIHTRRDYLVEAFKPDLVSPAQPVRLRYTGATTTLEIDAWYVGGLEGSLVGEDGVVEQPVVRLLSEDPWWYALAHGSLPLTTNLSVANADYVVKETAGLWASVSTLFNEVVYALALDPAGNLYVGGNFTDVGDANGDRIVKVAPDGTISSLGTGAPDGQVWALAIGIDGTLYAGGSFNSMGGVANTAGIASWNGAAWSAMGTGATVADTVWALTVGNDGSLYAGGLFNLMGGVANTVNIAKWSGGVWSALSTGTNDAVYGISVGLDSSIYVGGVFTLAGGVANTVRVAKWNGSAWSALGSGADNTLTCLAVAPDGTLYAGGYFHAIGGTTCLHIAQWNGASWSALGSGVDDIVWRVFVSQNGMLYAGGQFTSAGGLTLADRVAQWNGSSWLCLPIDLPGAAVVRAITENNTIQYFGYETSGTAYASAQTTVTNAGSRTAYPRIKINRDGGTIARVEYLKNETTGDTIWLNYSLLDDETLTIDLDYQRDPTTGTSKTSGRKRITSSYFGDVIGRALLPGSDFASFGLAPGSNIISAYVYVSGAPTVACSCEYREPYWSPDGAI